MSEVDAYIESLMGERLMPLRNDTDRLKRELSSAKRDIDALTLKLEKIEKDNKPEKEDDKLQPPASLSGAGDHLRIIGGEEYKTRMRIKYNGPFAGIPNYPTVGKLTVKTGYVFTGMAGGDYAFTKEFDLTNYTGIVYPYLEVWSDDLSPENADYYEWGVAEINAGSGLITQGDLARYRIIMGQATLHSEDHSIAWEQWQYGPVRAVAQKYVHDNGIAYRLGMRLRAALHDVTIGE